MEEVVKKYTQNLKRHMIPKAGNADGLGKVALVGYLGPQILAKLYPIPASPPSSTSTAPQTLVSGQSPSMRLVTASIADSKDASSSSKQILGPRLDLYDKGVDDITLGADIILYNAWKPDFSLPLSSF